MKRGICFFLVFLMIWFVSFNGISFSLTECVAESKSRIDIDLKTATDEELIQVIELVKEEQRSRVKTNIRLDADEISLIKGKSQKIKAEVLDLGDGVKAGKIQWMTEDPTVATVNNGTIKAVGPGSTSIHCASVLSDGIEVTAECTVTVWVPVQSITLDVRSVEVMAGEAIKPSFVFKPEDVTNKNVIYTIQDETIVKADDSGNLQGLFAGKTTVVATAADGSGKSTKFEVVVTKRLGKYDGEITFSGVPWELDYSSCIEVLVEKGLDKKGVSRTYAFNNARFWPEDIMAFGKSWINHYIAPNIFYEKLKGAFSIGLWLPKRISIGGHQVSSIDCSFAQGIKDGKVDPEETQLIGVLVKFYTSGTDRRDGYEMFNDLLTQLEGKYGEFDKYISGLLVYPEESGKDIREAYEILKKTLSDAKRCDNRYSTQWAFCVLTGENNTGVALLLDAGGSIYLFYGKTDKYKKIQELAECLEIEGNTSLDAGL